jgi:hypothetical protein
VEAPVNYDQLRNNIGWRMRIAPQAIHMDEYGRELPGKDEDWIIRSFSDAAIEIEDGGFLSRLVKLGKDHVQSFATDPQRAATGAAGVHYGMLKLLVQMYISPISVWFVPCVRPGERVPPPLSQFTELFVDLEYPVKSGIHQKLEAAGYRTALVNASRVPTLEHEGWEVVVERDQQGRPTSFHVRNPTENQVYVKKRV